MTILNPSVEALERAAHSACHGATQEEREMAASVLLVAAMQARESVNALTSEVERLRQIEAAVLRIVSREPPPPIVVPRLSLVPNDEPQRGA